MLRQKHVEINIRWTRLEKGFLYCMLGFVLFSIDCDLNVNSKKYVGTIRGSMNIIEYNIKQGKDERHVGEAEYLSKVALTPFTAFYYNFYIINQFQLVSNFRQSFRLLNFVGSALFGLTPKS